MAASSMDCLGTPDAERETPNAGEICIWRWLPQVKAVMKVFLVLNDSHAFIYARNNGVNKIDPFGLQATDDESNVIQLVSTFCDTLKNLNCSPGTVKACKAFAFGVALTGAVVDVTGLVASIVALPVIPEVAVPAIPIFTGLAGTGIFGVIELGSSLGLF